jgi:hypothetical protein
VFQGVQQPCEDPSVDSSSNLQNSKSSLPVPVCTLTQCPPGRVVQNSSELLSSSELTTEFFSVHSLHWLNAHLAELYRTQREFLSATVFFSTALPPEVFNNLKVFLELMISALVPTWHVFV